MWTDICAALQGQRQNFKTRFKRTIKWSFLAAIFTILVLVASAAALDQREQVVEQLKVRVERQAEEDGVDGQLQGEEEPEAEGKGKGKQPVSLGQILGILFLVCCILYCIGISYKVYKICKGTYVEEEPVFLKYK